MHRHDAKSAIHIILIDFFEGCEDLQDRAVREMIHRSETYFLTQSKKEWNLVNKENF